MLWKYNHVELDKRSVLKKIKFLSYAINVYLDYSLRRTFVVEIFTFTITRRREFHM